MAQRGFCVVLCMGGGVSLLTGIWLRGRLIRLWVVVCGVVVFGLPGVSMVALSLFAHAQSATPDLTLLASVVEVGGDGSTSGLSLGTKRAQKFTTGNSVAELVQVELVLYEQPADTSAQSLTVTLEAPDGDGNPDGTVLATATVTGDNLQESSPVISFDSSVTLAVNTDYFIVMHYSTTTSPGKIVAYKESRVSDSTLPGWQMEDMYWVSSGDWTPSDTYESLDIDLEGRVLVPILEEDDYTVSFPQKQITVVGISADTTDRHYVQYDPDTQTCGSTLGWGSGTTYEAGTVITLDTESDNGKALCFRSTYSGTTRYTASGEVDNIDVTVPTITAGTLAAAVADGIDAGEVNSIASTALISTPTVNDGNLAYAVIPATDSCEPLHGTALHFGGSGEDPGFFSSEESWNSGIFEIDSSVDGPGSIIDDSFTLSETDYVITTLYYYGQNNGEGRFKLRQSDNTEVTEATVLADYSLGLARGAEVRSAPVSEFDGSVTFFGVSGIAERYESDTLLLGSWDDKVVFFSIDKYPYRADVPTVGDIADEGSYKVCTRAHDAAGNVSYSTSADFSVTGFFIIVADDSDGSSPEQEKKIKVRLSETAGVTNTNWGFVASAAACDSTATLSNTYTASTTDQTVTAGSESNNGQFACFKATKDGTDYYQASGAIRGIDTTAPVLSSPSSIGTTDDTTPSFTFTSDEAGTISYAGGCSSTTTAATASANTVTFADMSVGTYSSCTVTVTDAVGNASVALAVPSFSIVTLSVLISNVDVSASTGTRDLRSSISRAQGLVTGGVAAVTMISFYVGSSASNLTENVFAVSLREGAPDGTELVRKEFTGDAHDIVETTGVKMAFLDSPAVLEANTTYYAVFEHDASSGSLLRLRSAPSSAIHADSLAGWSYHGRSYRRSGSNEWSVHPADSNPVIQVAFIGYSIDLKAGSDSGEDANDGITSVTTPTIVVSGLAEDVPITVTATHGSASAVTEIITAVTNSDTAPDEVTLGTLAEGEWSITATDGTTTTPTLTVTVDTTDPTVTPGTVSDSIISATATDTNGVAAGRYIIQTGTTCDSTAIADATGTAYTFGDAIVLAAADNNKYVCFRATDTVGNHGYGISAQISGAVDFAITVTDDSDGSDAEQEKEIAVRLSTTTGVTNTNWGFVATAAACDSTATTLSNSYTASTTDETVVADNESNNGQFACFKATRGGTDYYQASGAIAGIDTTPPVITAGTLSAIVADGISSAENTTSASTALISTPTVDNGTLSYAVVSWPEWCELTDGASYAAAISTINAITTDGYYRMCTRAVDTAGNASYSTSATFVRDITAPVLSVESVSGDDIVDTTEYESDVDITVSGPFDTDTVTVTVADSGSTTLTPDMVVRGSAASAETLSDSVDRFGAAITVDGSRLIVGAFRDGTGGHGRGAVYIYEDKNSDGDYSDADERIKLSSSTPGISLGNGDEFGYAVAVDGSRIIVGAPYDDTGGTDRGAVYILEDKNSDGRYDGTGENIKLSHDTPGITLSNGENFGAAVAVDGNRLAILDISPFPFDASVWILEDENGDGDYNDDEIVEVTQSGDMPASLWDETNLAALALDGDRLILGYETGGDPQRGAVYVLEDKNGDGDYRDSGELIRKIHHGTSGIDLDPADHFGSAVAVDGSRIIVGAESDDDGHSNAGAVYILEDKDNDGDYDGYGENIKINYSTPGISLGSANLFGSAVFMDGNRLIVGAQGDSRIYDLSLDKEFTAALSSAEMQTLSAGAVTVTADGADGVGNAAATVTRTFAILPIIGLKSSSDTGADDGDGITSSTTPTVVVSNAPANTAVVITATHGTVSDVTATITASENTDAAVDEKQLSTLAEGEWSITATVGSSTTAPPLVITVDTTAPAITPGTVSGNAISATATDTNDVVTGRYIIQTGSTCDSTAIVDNTGTAYSFGDTIALAVADNNKYVCFRATDTAGNIGYGISAQISGVIDFITVTDDSDGSSPEQEKKIKVRLSETTGVTNTNWGFVASAAACDSTATTLSNTYTASTTDQTVTASSESNNGQFACFKATKSGVDYYQASGAIAGIDTTAPTITAGTLAANVADGVDGTESVSLALISTPTVNDGNLAYKVIPATESCEPLHGTALHFGFLSDGGPGFFSLEESWSSLPLEGDTGSILDDTFTLSGTDYVIAALYYDSFEYFKLRQSDNTEVDEATVFSDYSLGLARGATVNAAPMSEFDEQVTYYGVSGTAKREEARKIIPYSWNYSTVFFSIDKTPYTASMPTVGSISTTGSHKVCTRAHDAVANVSYSASADFSVTGTITFITVTDDSDGSDAEQEKEIKVRLSTTTGVTNTNWGFVDTAAACDGSATLSNSYTASTTDQTITASSESNNGQVVCFKATKGGTDYYQASGEIAGIDATVPTVTPGTVSDSIISATATDTNGVAAGRYIIQTGTTCDSTAIADATGTAYTFGDAIVLAAADNNKYVCFRATDTVGNHGYGISAQISGAVDFAITVTDDSDGSDAEQEKEIAVRLSTTTGVTNTNWGFVATAAACDSTATTLSNSYTASTTDETVVADNESNNGQFACFKATRGGTDYYQASGAIAGIDTTPPSKPSVPDLDATDDSGTANDDDITNFSGGLTFTVTADVGAEVSLLRADTAAGTGNEDRIGSPVTADAAGKAVIDIDLTEGTHYIFAVAADAAGNEADLSDPLTLVIDYSGPSVSDVSLAYVATDGFINDAEKADTNPIISQPTIIDNFDPSPTVEYKVLVYGVQNCFYGLSVFSGSSLPTPADITTDGEYEVCVAATDHVSYTNVHSSTVFTRDTAASEITVAAVAAASTITATVDSVAESGWYVKKTASSCAASDFDGSEISYTFGTPIQLTTADNTKYLCFKSEDSAGNTDYEVSVQIAAVTNTATITLSDASDSGSDSDHITNDNTPTVAVSGFTGAVTVTAAKAGETDVTAQRTGDGEVTLGTLADGAWSITASDSSNTSPALEVTIDTVDPVISSAPTLVASLRDGFIDYKDYFDSDAGFGSGVPLMTTPTITDADTALTITYAVLDAAAACDSAATVTGTRVPVMDDITAGAGYIICVRGADTAGNIVHGASSSFVRDIDVPDITVGAIDLAADTITATVDSSANIGWYVRRSTSSCERVFFPPGDPVSGVVSYTFGTPVQLTTADNGKYFCFMSADEAGNFDLEVSAQIAEVTTAATVAVAETSDHGISDIDGITNDNTPTLVVSGFGSTDTVMVTATKAGESNVTAQRTGSGEVTLGTLADGVWSVTATNSTSTVTTPALEVTIDTVDPVLTSAMPTLINAAADGFINADEQDDTRTVITEATFSDNSGLVFRNYNFISTCDPVDIGVYNYYGVLLAVTVAITPDYIVYTYGGVLDGTVQKVCAIAGDAAGNVVFSDALSITFDFSASEITVGAVDTMANTITATVDSSAESGWYVKKAASSCAASDFDGSETVYTFGTALQLTTVDNTKYLCFKSVDEAGNTDYEASAQIAGVTTITAAVALKDTSDSGSSDSDNITNDNTPTLVVSGFGVTDTVTVTAVRTGSSDVAAQLTGNGEVTLGTLEEGTWTITAAGGTDTATLEVIIDTTALEVYPELVRDSRDGYINSAESSRQDSIAGVVLVTTSVIDGYSDHGTSVTTYALLNALDSNDVCDATTTFTATEPKSNTLSADGTYTICFRVVDAAGHTTYANSPSFIRDTDVPDITVGTLDTTADTITATVDSSAESGWYVKKTASSCAASDFDGSETAYTFGTALQLTTVDNTKYLCFKAEDAAGNIDHEASALISGVTTSVAIDLKDTSDSGPSDADNITNDNTPTLVVSGFGVTDTVTVTAVYDGISSDVTAQLTGNGEVTLAALSNGVWNITASGGSLTSPTLQVTIDTVNPTLTGTPVLAGVAADGVIIASEKDSADEIITAPTGGDTVTSATVTFAVLASTASCNDTATVTDTTSPPVNSLVADGVFRVCVRATDDAGNTTHAVSSLFVRDVEVPTITVHAVTATNTIRATVSSSGNGWYVKKTANSCAASDFDGSAETAYIFDTPIQLFLADNTKYFCFKSQDGAGNTDYAISAQITGILPTIDLSAASDSGQHDDDDITNLQTLTFTVSGYEADAEVTVTATHSSATDVTGNRTGDGEVTLTLPTPSVRVWSVTATDGTNVTPALEVAIYSVGLENTFSQTKINGVEAAVNAGTVYLGEGDVISLRYTYFREMWGTPTGTVNGAPVTVTLVSTTGSGDTAVSIYDIAYTIAADTTEGELGYSVTARHISGTESLSDGLFSNLSNADSIIADVTDPVIGAVTLAGDVTDGFINDAEKASTTALISVPTVTDNYDSSPDLQYAFVVSSAACSTGTPADDIPEPADITTDGEYKICVYATDDAGNVGSQASPVFTRDTTAPDITVAAVNTTTDTIIASVSTTASAGWYVKKTASSCAAADFTGSEIAYTFGAPVQLTAADNTKYLCFKSVDAVGNTDYQASAVISGVTTPASVDLMPGSDTGASNSDNVTAETTLTFVVSGFTGLVTVTAAKAGVSDVTAQRSGDGTVALGALTDGVWSVTATDGNYTSPPLSVTIDTVDPVLTGAPALAGAAAADGFINDAEKIDTNSIVADPTVTDTDTSPLFTYAVLASDGVCDSTVTVTATAVTPASSVSSDGVYTICVKIADTAGNTIYAATPALTRDTVTPVIRFTAEVVGGTAQDGTTYLRAGDALVFSISPTVSEAMTPSSVEAVLSLDGREQTVTLSRDAAATYTYRYTVPSGVEAAAITLDIAEGTIGDLAGNTVAEAPAHTISSTVVIDSVAPALTLSPFVVSEGAGSVTVTVSDTRPDTDSYLYRVVSDEDDCGASTGGEVYTSGTAIAVDLSSSGYLCVQARDLVGNAAYRTRDLSVQVPPEVIFVSSLDKANDSRYLSQIIAAQAETGTHPHGYLLTDMVFELVTAFAASENNILEVQVEKGCSLMMAENSVVTTFTIDHTDLETTGQKTLTIPDNTTLAPNTCYTFVFTYTNTDSTTMGHYQSVTGATPDSTSQPDWGGLSPLIIRRDGVSYVNEDQDSLKIALRGHLLPEPPKRRRGGGRSGVGLVKRTGSSLGHLADFFIDPLRDLTKQVYHFGRDLALGSSGEDVRQLKLFLEQQNRIAAEPAAFEEVVYRLGDSHPDIKEAQELLNQTTCPVATTGSGSPGQETEYFGSLTRQAVLCFQQEHNLPITATITSTLLETLMRHTAPSPFTSTETEYDDRQDETDVYVEYRLGDSHPDIKEAQELLNQTTCPVATTGSGSPGQETEYFGSLTRQAVLCFQQEHNLPITATITSSLLENLRRHVAGSVAGSADGRTFTRDLGVGSSGEDVRLLNLFLEQQRLTQILGTTGGGGGASGNDGGGGTGGDDDGGGDDGNSGGDQGQDNQGADDGAFTRDLGVGSSGEDVRLLNLFLEQQNTPLNTENNTPAPITPLNAIQRPRSFVAPSF